MPITKNMRSANVRAWRRIPEEQAELTGVAFLLAHPAEECRESVEIQRGPWSLVCWCGRCKDIRTFELVAPDADPRPG